MLAGIDVYKNAPANIIEGGIGGAVNLRTRRPFDSAGQVISLTARGNYYDRVDKFGGSISGLYSNRFDSTIGEIGILVNAVYSKSQYRQDGLLAGPFAEAQPGTIANAPANARIPYGFEIYDDSGDRRRFGIAAALQWQANEDVLVTAQYQGTKYWFNRTGAYYYDYNNRSNQYNAAGQVTSYGTGAAPARPSPSTTRVMRPAAHSRPRRSRPGVSTRNCGAPARTIPSMSAGRRPTGRR
ncbi:hypothetical protein P0F65_16240 [Sphingomonas sp. I4]